jgi:hypothetical protein
MKNTTWVFNDQTFTQNSASMSSLHVKNGVISHWKIESVAKPAHLQKVKSRKRTLSMEEAAVEAFRTALVLNSTPSSPSPSKRRTTIKLQDICHQM